MKPLTHSQKEKIVSRIFWDVDKTLFDWQRLLDDDPPDVENPESQMLYRRLLISCDWYTLLKLMSPVKIKALVDSPILDTLYPRDIQYRLLYARNVLSETNIPLSE